jgi:uncharacterized protein YecA (UPF0149 family)
MTHHRLSLIIVAALTVFATGMSAQESQPTTQPAAVEPAVLDASEALFVGTWEADFAVMAAEMSATEGVGEQERAMMAQMFENAEASMTINADYTATYHYSMMGQVEDKTGTWAVTTLDGTSMVVTITEEDGDVETFNLTFSDASTLIMGTGEPGEPNMTWRRQ